MFKRIMSVVISAVTVVGFIPHIPAKAEESGLEPYPYTLFASSSEDGAITVNAGNFCVNGNVATNGTIVSSGNININGTRTEQAEESMIYIFDKIDSRYFSEPTIDEHEENYILEELNININTPTEVYGEATLTGNININSALKALEDVNLYGEVKNTNDSVIFSKYGDIVIDSQNVNLNGLVYAPFGNVTVNAQNLNLNNVVIIAQSIVLTCPNVNANTSSSMSSFVGSESEPLEIPYDEWEYMKDENDNDFPDFFEDINNWSQLKDSDGDKLPDCVEEFIGSESLNSDTDNDGIDDYYEVFVLFTDPTLVDSDENGTSDYDEDFDEDLLINGQEYLLETDPWNNDSDNDDISDGDEVNTYHTDPLKKDTDNDKLEDSDEFLFNTDPNNPDTNGNGILDGDEKFAQTFTYTVENEDCAVEEVIVSMNGTGNIQKNTSVESIMNKDMICSDVVGLVGEPFEIETESQFDNATLSFKINKSKLGDTNFDDLMFLWYDEENYEFVELETFYDDTNSIVSINTTHFSRYMVVDKNMWFEAWSEDLNQISDSHEKSACYFVLAVDCSGSMDWNDPTTIIIPNSPPYKPVNMCERHKAVSNFAASLDYDDKAAIVTFEDSANIVCEMTNNESDLYWASANFYNSGGTSFDAAISKSVEILNNNPSATRKKIILLTDGESSISNTILQEAIDAHIKIYTIGLGNSSDGILKRIANETGGEFFKAYTAQELVSIYTNNGFDNDFDTTDTDDDGLYDAVEAAGIRIQNGKKLFNKSENGLVFTDPTNQDTDFDGLKDGEEIDPTIRYKKTYWCPPEIEAPNNRSYYFIMESNPTEKDTDFDNINDYEDCYPLNPEASLDDEELFGLYQYFLDLESENMSKRVYWYTPEDWEDELYNNINETVSMIPEELTQAERTIIIDSIVIIEANSLQEKYKTVYYASDNFINKYITQPGFHKGLKPLFTQYPIKNKNNNKYLKAFFDGFTGGFKQGLMFAVTDTIATYEYNDSMAYARNVGKAGELASGIKKNTRHIESITKTAQYRIPDGLDDASMVLSEVKNVKYQGLTSQIKDFLYYSQREGYQFELYVRKTTKLSKPLQELIDSGEIVIRYLP